MLACATCGSDVQAWYVARKLPAVLGHEPVGEVVEVGAGVDGVAVGDRVAIHHHAPCGECRRCRRGHETLCERFRSTRARPRRVRRVRPLQAELVGELLPLDGLDPVRATFTEPLACALRAQRRAGVRPGDAVLVVGAGCSGLLHIAAAHARGVEAVWVREPQPDRLERAERWGADRPRQRAGRRRDRLHAALGRDRRRRRGARAGRRAVRLRAAAARQPAGDRRQRACSCASST